MTPGLYFGPVRIAIYSFDRKAKEWGMPEPVKTDAILLVEDDVPVRRLVKQVLEREGYRVLEASSGTEALKMWPDCCDSVGLLFTDYVMPEGVNGRQLIETLLKDKPDLRVIVSSGYSMEIAGADFHLKEGINFIGKPFELEKLLVTVRRCLAAGPSGSPFEPA